MARASYPRFRPLHTPGKRQFGIAIDRGPSAKLRFGSLARDIESKPLALAMIAVLNIGASIALRPAAQHRRMKGCRNS